MKLCVCGCGLPTSQAKGIRFVHGHNSKITSTQKTKLTPEELRLKRSLSHKGQIPWNKGKKYKLGSYSNRIKKSPQRQPRKVEDRLRLEDLIMVKFKQPPKKGLERYREIMRSRERNSIHIVSSKVEDEWYD